MTPTSLKTSRRTASRAATCAPRDGACPSCYPEPMHLKILVHPVFVNLNYHMPMIVDLSHPLIMLQGENGSGKSTLLHSIHLALRGEQVDGYIYRLEPRDVIARSYLFDAEQHNPRVQLELFKDQP